LQPNLLINDLNQIFLEMAVMMLLTVWYNCDWHCVTHWICWFHRTQSHSCTITVNRNQLVVILFCPQGAGCDKTKSWHFLLLLRPRFHSLLGARHPVAMHVGEQKGSPLTTILDSVLCVVCDLFPHIYKPSSGRLKYVNKHVYTPHFW